MSKYRHFAPEYQKGQFHCPHCNVFAKQFWAYLGATTDPVIGQVTLSVHLGEDWVFSKRQNCGKYMIWNEEHIVYPKAIPVELPNKDINQDIIADYMEAAGVFSGSPRSAAALLRLALQKLCKQLGQSGDNINDDIRKLVEDGLNPLVQKSLDALRITGNNAVHPGELNLQETPEKVLKLFDLLNFIASKMITEPKEIGGVYAGLPEGARSAVERRDGNEQGEH